MIFLLFCMNTKNVCNDFKQNGYNILHYNATKDLNKINQNLNKEKKERFNMITKQAQNKIDTKLENISIININNEQSNDINKLNTKEK